MTGDTTANVRTRSVSAAVERMRLYRKRCRDGMQYVRIPSHVTDIDGLIRMRLLKEEQRQDVARSARDRRPASVIRTRGTLDHTSAGAYALGYGPAQPSIRL